MLAQTGGMSLCHAASTLDISGMLYSSSSWIEEDGLRFGSSWKVSSCGSLGWGGNTLRRHVHLGQRAMIEGTRDRNAALIDRKKT